MRLYEHSKSNFDEIKDYYPVWYRDVLEMSGIWKTMGKQLDSVRDGIIQAVNNAFISTADAETISKLEKFLYITYDGPRTLEERRALIASFFIGSGHIGEKELKEIVSAFTTGEITVSLVGGSIEISVTREISERFNLSDCSFIVGKRIPAHLGLLFNDVLLPIRLINKESFYLRAVDFLIRFYNGVGNLPVRLNGDSLLDGTWLLSQGITLLAFPLFLISGIAYTNTNKVTQLFSAYEKPFKTSNTLQYSKFKIATRGKSPQNFRNSTTNFECVMARQTGGIKAEIVIDSMYKLNGVVALDSTRKLNANIIKEAI